VARPTDPVIKKEAWTPEEDKVLIAACARLGSSWTLLAALLPPYQRPHQEPLVDSEIQLLAYQTES
jgi:hypothetical protein